MDSISSRDSRRIGFVSTRIGGTDGVTLEIVKWAEILERMGHTCFYIAGQCDVDPERSMLIPEAHFRHPTIDWINRQCFGRTHRNPDVTAEIHEMRWVIKEKLHTAIKRLDLDLLIAENCVTIPMNLPLGLAIVETVMETGIACIAHHHDFFWERERFLVNAVDDYLRAAFPPVLTQIQHVAINSQAAQEFSRRTGLHCRMIPNIMDFEHPPEPSDAYSRGFRAALGLSAEDILVLQPTRIVQRKGIEHSIELVRLLGDPHVKLVITHSAGDEGESYPMRVLMYAKLMGVDVILAAPWIANERETTPDGKHRFTIADAYREADFVTYASTYEGFGNAFLEAVYFRKPIMCNRYSIYRTDIEPCGFDAIVMDGFLTDKVVDQVRLVLRDEDRRQRMVEHNYNVAKRFFSYHRAEAELLSIISAALPSPTVEVNREGAPLSP